MAWLRQHRQLSGYLLHCTLEPHIHLWLFSTIIALKHGQDVYGWPEAAPNAAGSYAGNENAAFRKSLNGSVRSITEVLFFYNWFLFCWLICLLSLLFRGKKIMALMCSTTTWSMAKFPPRSWRSSSEKGKTRWSHTVSYSVHVDVSTRFTTW